MDLAEGFLLGKQVAGCTEATICVYRAWMKQICAQVSDVSCLDSPAVTRFFAILRERAVSASTVHQAYRTLKTFCRWLVATGALERDPLAGMKIRTPATLPRVPTGDELRAVLGCCPTTFEGARNRAIILVMADAGLRAGEVLRLIVEDWTPQERSLFIREGKGLKDRVAFASPTTARALKQYFAARARMDREDYLFVDAKNRPIQQRHLATILHRLSARAGLPRSRWLHPHGLRHFAATSWLRNGVGLDQVRRLLGHSSLNTTLRYSSLVAADLQQAHRDASAIERIGLDRGRVPQRRGAHSGDRDHRFRFTVTRSGPS